MTDEGETSFTSASPAWMSFNIVWIAIGLAGAYWFFEPAVNAFWLHEGSFLNQWLHPDLEAFRVRVAVVILLLLLSVYAQVMISRQNKINIHLNEQKQQNRQIVDTAQDGFIAMDTTGRIIDWNPQAETILAGRGTKPLAGSLEIRSYLLNTVRRTGKG